MILGKIACDEYSSKEEFIAEYQWFLSGNPDNPNNELYLQEYIENFDLEKVRKFTVHCNMLLYGRRL